MKALYNILFLFTYYQYLAHDISLWIICSFYILLPCYFILCRHLTLCQKDDDLYSTTTNNNANTTTTTTTNKYHHHRRHLGDNHNDFRLMAYFTGEEANKGVVRERASKPRVVGNGYLTPQRFVKGKVERERRWVQPSPKADPEKVSL